MPFHLLTHSAFSLLEGLALPSELAQAAAAAGMPALGLADHRLLSGAVEFVSACRREGVRPLLGLEVDLPGQPRSGRLALLATSLEGWSSLCQLSSAMALRDEPEAPAPLDLLSAHSADLLAIGPLNAADPEELPLGRLAELFPGRFYIALEDPAQGVALTGLGRRLRLPLVAAPPVFYLHPEQAALQRTTAATRLNLPLSRLPEHAAAPEGACFLSQDELQRRFEAFPKALEAQEEIAGRCRLELPLGKPHMPSIPLPPGQTAAETLRRKAEEGARRLYGVYGPPVQARLDHELATIARLGYEPIFLIVEEVLNFARQSGVPYSSRGSAASSLVAHCLGITSPDPLELDLYFERFLNPARSTPPDIDTDLCSRRRDTVIRHVFETFGAERVAMVATINRYRPRSAVTDAARAHGLTPEAAHSLSEQLPYAFWSAREEEAKPAASPFAELRQAYPSPQYQQIFDDAEALLKLPRHLSVHPGGLVVAPGEGALAGFAPLMRSGSKGVIITQFDLDSVEALGLVKIDLLGIRGLTVLGDVAEAIDPGCRACTEVLDAIPGEDAATSDRVEKGQTIGCFNIESPGMRGTLREIRARTPKDILAALALYRPGPIQGGLRDAFVRRFRGDEPVQHLHPALAPLLGDTYGVILYQEQVLRIANGLAGFSLAEGDLLRRGMSHFDPGKQMNALRDKFINGAQERSGVPPEVGAKVWEMMAAFAGYGFPKAHAASYAQIAWRSAWCKTHFPAEFMAAVLANWGGYYSQRVYLSEARRLGLAVLPPHVNYSLDHFAVINRAGEGQPPDKVLFMGLEQVKELTRRTIERIRRERPFYSLEDFLARADPRPQEAVNLARVGALEGLGTIPGILQRLEEGGSWQAGQPGLFNWLEPGLEDWSLGEKVEAQQELLGTGVDAHPLELVASQIARAGAITTAEAVGRVGRRVLVAGVRQAGRRSKTAKGEWMMFLTLEDLEGMLDVVVFPDAYQRSKGALFSSSPLLVSGVVEQDATRDEPLLRADMVSLIK